MDPTSSRIPRVAATLCGVGLALTHASLAWAQTGSSPAAPSPAGSATTTAPATSATSPEGNPTTTAPAPAVTTTGTPAPAPVGCVPNCRDGFVCHAGRCLSACNPPCPPEQRCTTDGQCVAPAAQSLVPAQAPPRYDSSQLYDRETQPQMSAPSRQTRPHRGLVMGAGLDLLLGGSGTGAISVDGSSESDTFDYDLDTSFGLHGTFGYRFGVVSLAGRLRWFTSQLDEAPDDADRFVHFDLGPEVTFHIGLGRAKRVEILLPLSLAYSIQIAPGSGSDGSGLAASFAPGVLFWVGTHVGIYANLGIDLHIYTWSEESFGQTIDVVDLFVNPRLSSGITFLL